MRAQSSRSSSRNWRSSRRAVSSSGDAAADTAARRETARRVLTDGLWRIRDPGHDDAELEAHGREPQEGLGTRRALGAREADRDATAGGLARRADRGARARDAARGA